MGKINLDRIKEFLKSEEIKVVLIFLPLIILIYFIFLMIKAVLPIVKDIFSTNFEEFTLNELLSSIYISIYFVITVGILLYILNKFHYIRINIWKCWTIILILVFSFIGVIFINMEFGLKRLSLRLNYADDISKHYGNISCSGVSKNILAYSKAYCSINPPLNVTFAELILTDENGYESVIDVTKLNFTTPHGNMRVYFNIESYDKGKKVHLSTVHYYNFLTKEEDMIRREKFLTYLIGLIIAVLFSVPAMMTNLKEL